MILKKYGVMVIKIWIKRKNYKCIKKRPMKQLELSEELFGNRSDGPRLYQALMKLVNDGVVIRNGSHPSIYSLANEKFVMPIQNTEKKLKDVTKVLMCQISNESLNQVHQDVMNSDNYGKENDLITACFKRFPKNDDVAIVAMKVGLIDITNSTHVSQHKTKISAVELAESIVKIKNIDERIKMETLRLLMKLHVVMVKLIYFLLQASIVVIII